MSFNLASTVGAFLLAFISYQPLMAGANTFTAKPIQVGDSLISILKENSFSEKERERVLAADAGLRDLFLTLDSHYVVKKAPDSVELHVFDSQTSKAFTILKSGTSIIAKPYRPNFKVSLKRIEGRVSNGPGSLLGTILAKVNSNWVASRFVDAYAFDIQNSKSIPKNARFWFSVEKLYENDQFIKYGEILRTSLEVNGTSVQKKFVRYKGGGVFFNAQDFFEERPFYAPVSYVKIASPFKLNRVHPITGRKQPHLGVDFELPSGYPVFSPRTGTVIRYGNNRAAGNYIVLLHSNGMQTFFNHLHRLDKRIRQGVKVFAGEKIAEVGCTGYCTRAHLHFAIKYKGHMVDPLKYLKPYPSYMKEVLENQLAQN
ncbi:MAG: M23 family metallopeptidase [Pseudobdellovibrionaceae bacterium]